MKAIKNLEWRTLRSRDKASISPDGKYIAYAAYVKNPKNATSVPDPADRHIYVLSADGSKEIDLPTGGEVNANPVWTADGGHLLFTSDRRGTSRDLWLLTIRDGHALGDPQLVEENFGDFRLVGRSANAYFYGQSDPGGFDVFLTALGPDGKIAASPMRLTENWLDANVAPLWSPDGKSIAFKKKRAGPDTYFDLVIRSLETGEERKFVTGQPQGGRPGWFHDSKALLTGQSNGHEQMADMRLYRMDARTGQKSPLPTNIVHSTNALSPDDKTLYFVTGPDPTVGKNDRYSAVDLTTGQERVIFTAHYPEERVVGIGVSPDGRTLAGFISLQPTPPQRPRPEGHLFLVGMDGKNYRELYSLPAQQVQLNQTIEWSADGKYLFFMQPNVPLNARVPWKLMRISPDGGDPMDTGLQLRGNVSTVNFDISPDGKQIAYATSQPGSSEVWELQNVLSVLNR